MHIPTASQTSYCWQDDTQLDGAFIGLFQHSLCFYGCSPTRIIQWQQMLCVDHNVYLKGCTAYP